METRFIKGENKTFEPFKVELSFDTIEDVIKAKELLGKTTGKLGTLIYPMYKILDKQLELHGSK